MRSSLFQGTALLRNIIGACPRNFLKVFSIAADQDAVTGVKGASGEGNERKWRKLFDMTDVYQEGGKIMRDLKAGSIMVRRVAIAKRNSPARDVALQLLSGLYSGMPVVNDEGQIIGVVTELDLLEAVDEGKELAKLTAEDVMTKETITVDLDTSASKMIKIMREKHIIRLPVTENGKVVGIVSRCDILRTVVDPYLVVL